MLIVTMRGDGGSFSDLKDRGVVCACGVGECCGGGTERRWGMV